MRAIQVQRVGGPDVLELQDLPDPKPGPGEARVGVAYAGVNFIDIYHRTGAYPGPTPFFLGLEGSGVVEAVGPDVADLRIGKRVAWAMHRGSYADKTVVPAWKLVPVPQDLDLRTAAAAMVQGMTAHFLSHSTFPLKTGHVALVHAAAGGVGQLLVQMAKARGATVIGTVSTPQKAALAKEAGADHTIDYTKEDFAAEAKRLTQGKGVHVVYDGVGRDTWEKSLASLRPRGMFVLYGAASGAVPPVDLQRLNHGGSLFATRPNLAHHTLDRAEVLGRAQDVFNMIREGRLQVRVDQTWPLAEAAKAHEHLEGRQSKGKLLLKVDGAV